MALVTVTFFHALDIYLYRCRDSPLGGLPAPARVQVALNELITAAYNAVSVGSVQLLERFQLSLLIAGLETRNPVHQDWIRANLSDAALKGVYSDMLLARGCSGIRMRTFREMMLRRSRPIV
jgi:hypothetical protein